MWNVWHVAGGFGLRWFWTGGDGWVDEGACGGGVGNGSADCAGDVPADYREIVAELASPVGKFGANDFRVAIEGDREFCK